MAKKSISKVKAHTGKSMAKLIFPVKMLGSGSYAFKQEMVPAEQVTARLAQR